MIIDRSKLTKEVFTFFRLLQRISSSNFQLTFWSRSHVQGENRVWNVFHGRGTHLRLELGGGFVTHLFIRVADLGIPCSCDPGDLRPAHSRSRSAVPFRFIYEKLKSPINAERHDQSRPISFQMLTLAHNQQVGGIKQLDVWLKSVFPSSSM